MRSRAFLTLCWRLSNHFASARWGSWVDVRYLLVVKLNIISSSLNNTNMKMKREIYAKQKNPSSKLVAVKNKNILAAYWRKFQGIGHQKYSFVGARVSVGPSEPTLHAQARITNKILRAWARAQPWFLFVPLMQARLRNAHQASGRVWVALLNYMSQLRACKSASIQACSLLAYKLTNL